MDMKTKIETKRRIEKMREQNAGIKSRNPFPTVDIIIEMPKGIILIDRKKYPFGWALPGGFINYNESTETAAVREAKEETSLDVKLLRQFHVYSDPSRDPRQHNLSVVFIAKPKDPNQKPKASDDAKGIGIFTKKTLPKPLVFDHPLILKDYFKKRY